MSYVLDVTTTDQYQELACPGTTRVTLQITGAQVLIGFGTGVGTASYGLPDEPFLPIVGGIYRACDRIRVKSKVKATPAHVTIQANP